MMAWITRSLFRRMISTLLFGLILAQALNRTIHLYQHHQLADQSSQLEAALRVADLIRLMSALKPETKQAVSEQFHDPILRLLTAKNPSKYSQTGEPSNPKYKVFRTALRDLLGQQQPKRMIITESSAQELLLTVLLNDDSTILLQVNLLSHGDGESSVLLHLAIILFAILGFSIVAVHWVTGPLEKLADAAERLGKDIHRPPLDENGPTEVSRAARAFNKMQASLIRHIQERTQLLAAISHDLKTPITRLRLRSELLDDTNLRERFQKDLDEMEDMVIVTLDFMRGVDQQEAFQPVDLMAIIESLQADALEIHENVTIQGAIESPYWGKPSALKRCITNLLDNALKYGQRASFILEDSDNLCKIRILDQGAGIPSDHLDKVFTPYYRLETSRNRNTGGTGLGLSIARDIAHLHDGAFGFS